MTGFSARRLASACAVSAASAVAFMAPSAASAAPLPIKGDGSTFQEFAQQKVFIPAFNEKNAKSKTGEVAEYKGVGSGAGLESWGNNGHAAEFNTWEYVGTDQPPNPTQKKAIETAAGGAVVLSIPTLQASEAIVMHLPAGCTSATSSDKKAPDRLVLNNVTLEGIFAHTITKWSEIKDDGDKLLPAGCEGTTPILRAVRKDGSGTTAIFKKYLFQINQSAVDGVKTWNNLAEENKNLSWPAETENLVRGEGNPGVLSAVAENDASIGYVVMANAYGNAAFRGEGGPEFWAFLQNNGLSTAKPKYADPEKPGKGGAEGASNCKKIEYVNGIGAAFPPESTEEAWNEVSAATTQKAYPLCGFTYDLSLIGFSLIEPLIRPSAGEVETVKNYFSFMVKEGAKLLKKGTDYEGLPTNTNPKKSVQAIAEAGVAKISE